MKNYKRSFRFVCKAHEKQTVEELLTLQGFRWKDDTFTSNACRLIDEPISLGLSLAAFFGFIYIQDRASMLPPVALQPPKGAFVLDMCASPGSKTGQLAMMLGEEGFIIGNEPSPPRLATLRRNLQQMNLSQAGSCCYSGQNIPLPDEFFDYIQLDPPCSGWGTIERNPNVMDMWKDDKTQPLIRLQKELLQEAQRLLKPNGVVVYSTCTTNVEENEKQVFYAQKELGLKLEDLPIVPEFVMDKPFLDCGSVWRLSPRIGDTQGFFVARLRKGATAGVSRAANDAPKNEWNDVNTVDEGNAKKSFTKDLSKKSSAQNFDSRNSVDTQKFDRQNSIWGAPLSKTHIEELGLDVAILDNGEISIFGESVHFVPHKAQLLPQAFSWQGMYMGKVSRAGDVLLSPRVRIMSNLPSMDFEGIKGIEQIKGLLCGQSISSEFAVKNVLLRWNGLTLGRVKAKNKRLIWTER